MLWMRVIPTYLPTYLSIYLPISELQEVPEQNPREAEACDICDDDDDDYTHPVMDDGPEPTLLLLDRAYWESQGIYYFVVCLLCTRTRRERS